MKKLLHIITLTVITSIIFSSCGKQMSMTKRKYNKGYYVSHSHKKQNVKSQSVAKSVNMDRIQPAAIKVKESAPTVNETQLTASGSAPVEVNNIEKNEIKPVNSTSAKKFYKVKPLEKLLPTKLYTSELRKKMLSADDGAQDALSLLWVVIVILLILYLIGLLAGGWGLGWAIHILVIVAVVLLILWLLRIL